MSIQDSAQGRPLRFAIVGCGSIATTHANALHALPAGLAEPAICCDLEETRAREFAAAHGMHARSFEQMLDDSSIDCVTICTPSGLHAEQGIRCLAAGKHVLIEKPMDISLAACDALLAAEKESGRKLAVVSQHRFDAASARVREILDSGELGRLVQAEARIPWYRSQEYYDSGDWRGTFAMDGGGCVMNQGIHTIDLLRWFCGPPTGVFARMQTAGHHGIEVEDGLCGTVSFANGILATVFASTSAYPGFPVSLALYGTDGSVILEGDELSVLAIRGQETQVSTGPNLHALQVAMGGTKAANENAGALSATMEKENAQWGDAHRKQFVDFIHCCNGNETPLVDGHQGRNAVEFVLALYDSAKSGREIIL